VVVDVSKHGKQIEIRPRLGCCLPLDIDGIVVVVTIEFDDRGDERTTSQHKENEGPTLIYTDRRIVKDVQVSRSSEEGDDDSSGEINAQPGQVNSG
jgi:hypothetical protein